MSYTIWDLNALQQRICKKLLTSFLTILKSH